MILSKLEPGMYIFNNIDIKFNSISVVHLGLEDIAYDSLDTLDV